QRERPPDAGGRGEDGGGVGAAAHALNPRLSSADPVWVCRTVAVEVTAWPPLRRAAPGVARDPLRGMTTWVRTRRGAGCTDGPGRWVSGRWGHLLRSSRVRARSVCPSLRPPSRDRER